MVRGRINREAVIALIENLGDECIDNLAQEFGLLFFEGNTRDKATKLVNDTMAHPTEQGHPRLIDKLISRAQQLPASLGTRRTQRSTHVNPSNTAANKIRVFISHSSKNVETAEKLVDLLKTGLIIEPEKIRCTSVTGHRLSGGSHTSERLREEIKAAELIIGIITPDSVESHYVLFELGASWVLEKATIPLLAQGANPLTMRAPLSELHAIQLSDINQVNQILDDIAGQTTIKPRVGSAAAIGAKAQALQSAALRAPA